VFTRGAVEVEFDLKPKFDLSNISAVDLLSALQSILSDVGEEQVTSIQRRKVSVRMRMREIWRRITESSGQLSFENLFEDDRSKVEIVITFLALLELLKQRKVKVRQEKAFAPIKIIPLTESNGS